MGSFCLFALTNIGGASRLRFQILMVDSIYKTTLNLQLYIMHNSTGDMSVHFAPNQILLNGDCMNMYKSLYTLKTKVIISFHNMMQYVQSIQWSTAHTGIIWR